MKNKVRFAVFMALVVALITGCSIFGGGDWKSGVVDTLSVKHDEFTMETEYSMQDASGFYYSVLPVKLSYTTGDEDIGGDPDWRMTITQYETMGLGRSFSVDNVAILNSRGDRFFTDINGRLDFYSGDATGGVILNDEEIAQLYQVFTDPDNLEYIRIRFNEDDDLVYDMTQPQAYAVTYFIDYIRNTVQPTEV